MYSDNKKKEYMRMFFDDQPSEFCEYTINRLKLKEDNKAILLLRYVDKLPDKVIARKYNLSPDRINKRINMALVDAYDSLKHSQYNDFKATK